MQLSTIALFGNADGLMPVWNQFHGAPSGAPAGDRERIWAWPDGALERTAERGEDSGEERSHQRLPMLFSSKNR